MIEMKDVTKEYRIGIETVHALNHANLHVKKGEFVGIIGPSGSGKSTLMNIIGCLDIADSGVYKLDGIPIEDYTEKELAKVRNEKIGFVFLGDDIINTRKGKISEGDLYPIDDNDCSHDRMVYFKKA